jgi:hypothetical protein
MRRAFGPAASLRESPFSFLICSLSDEAQPRTEVADAHSRIGVEFEQSSIRFAQAVIVEAELHRRRFPNLACGGSRVHNT